MNIDFSEYIHPNDPTDLTDRDLTDRALLICERIADDLLRHVENYLRAEAQKQPSTPPPFSIVNFILDYESGEIDDDETIIAGFQCMINDGTVWHLQGSYGRTAQQLIEAGYCTQP